MDNSTQATPKQVENLTQWVKGITKSFDMDFYPMSLRPPASLDEPSFSKAVLIYDSDELNYAEIGYFDLESENWQQRRKAERDAEKRWKRANNNGK